MHHLKSYSVGVRSLLTSKPTYQKRYQKLSWTQVAAILLGKVTIKRRGKNLTQSNHNLGPVGICLVASHRLNPCQHVLQLFPLSGLWHPMAQKEVSTARLAHIDLDIICFFSLPLLVSGEDSKIVNGWVMYHQFVLYNHQARLQLACYLGNSVCLSLGDGFCQMSNHLLFRA